MGNLDSAESERRTIRRVGPWTILNAIMSATSLLTLLSQASVVTLVSGVKAWATGIDSLISSAFAWAPLVGLEITRFERNFATMMFLTQLAAFNANRLPTGNRIINSLVAAVVIALTLMVLRAKSNNEISFVSFGLISVAMVLTYALVVERRYKLSYFAYLLSLAGVVAVLVFLNALLQG